MVPTAKHYCNMIRNAIFNGNNHFYLKTNETPKYMLGGFPKNLREFAIFEDEVCPIKGLVRFGRGSQGINETTELESYCYNRSKLSVIETGTPQEITEVDKVRANYALAVGPDVLVNAYMKQLGEKDDFNCVSFNKLKTEMDAKLKEESGDDAKE